MPVPKIIILSDGTGNAASSVWRTNVWRMFQALDLRENDQAAKYDDGVGTSSFLPLAILGGAFGYGLKRNVLDCYKFICRNYDHANKSKIYLFGFSRGAFTARVLAGLILQQGLVRADTEGELHNGAVKAYRAYRAQRYHSNLRIEVLFRAIRDFLIVPIIDLVTRQKAYSKIEREKVPNIEFVGVWDTVAAYGFPIDEMTRGISSWIWPLELPNRVLSDHVLCARHALALDDERTTFHPVLWTEQEPGQAAPPPPARIDDQRLVQVWFVGMHSNVGGGYPDDAVAFVPLYWMLTEAQKRGLVFKLAPKADPDTVLWISSSQDKDGRLYDSRAGLGAYYRYGPRKVHDLCNDRFVGVSVPTPLIHESVFGRIDSGCNAYGPLGLPPSYATVKEDGSVVPLGPQTFETPAEATARHKAQELLWNYVWLRRIAYFATLAATLHLAAFAFFHDRNPEHEFESPIRLVSEAVRAIESVLPRQAVRWWTDWYAANPEWFLGGIIVLALLMGWSSALSGRIKDAMRVIWRTRGAVQPIPASTFQNAVYAFRTSKPYTRLIRIGKRHVVPALLVLGLVWTGATALSHLLFNVADSMGAYCEGTKGDIPKVTLGIPQPAKDFQTSSLCSATGLSVAAGYRYEITITVTSPWVDDTIATTPVGFRTSSLEWPTRWVMRSGILLRRILFRPWFRLIARVGEKGVDEYFLDPVLQQNSEASRPVYKATFKSQRSGELFLHVNDAVIGLPWLTSSFFRNNQGAAKVTVRLL
uniref:T6SS Phospholipase effector Tle1-like catalytic domain-containing protein n=1 Tax=Rhodopseudomonas palustris (strain DX-1) TaxID=652103 RepID=E6VQ24_RHOPX